MIMGCCGSKKKNQPGTVNLKKIQYSSAVKSSRIPPGSVLRQCPTCKTQTITKVCPICNITIFEEKK